MVVAQLLEFYFLVRNKYGFSLAMSPDVDRLRLGLIGEAFEEGGELFASLGHWHNGRVACRGGG